MIGLFRITIPMCLVPMTALCLMSTVSVEMAKHCKILKRIRGVNRLIRNSLNSHEQLRMNTYASNRSRNEWIRQFHLDCNLFAVSIFRRNGIHLNCWIKREQNFDLLQMAVIHWQQYMQTIKCEYQLCVKLCGVQIPNAIWKKKS